MRTGKSIFITGGTYSVHTDEKMKGFVPVPSALTIQLSEYKPTEEEERFNDEHFVDIELPHGQRAIVLDEYCRKTGLREDDGSDPSRYLDAGTILILKLIGGDNDGLVVDAHDPGNYIEIDDDNHFIATIQTP
jgi:hypothetical protein